MEVVRRVYEAVARRDTEAVLALYAEDIEWDDYGTAAASLGGPSIHRGHDELRAWFREWYDAWENMEDDVLELIDAGEHVISIVKTRARGRRSGLEVAGDVAGVWTVRDGKVVRVAWFATREEALGSIGLSA